MEGVAREEAGTEEEMEEVVKEVEARAGVGRAAAMVGAMAEAARAPQTRQSR